MGSLRELSPAYIPVRSRDLYEARRGTRERRAVLRRRATGMCSQLMRLIATSHAMGQAFRRHAHTSQDAPTMLTVGEGHMHLLFARTFGVGSRGLMIELRDMVVVLLLVFYNATHLLCELPQTGIARLDKRRASELGNPLRLKKNPYTNACIKAFSDIARHLASRGTLFLQPQP
jgi:hypothetical protein